MSPEEEEKKNSTLLKTMPQAAGKNVSEEVSYLYRLIQDKAGEQTSARLSSRSRN